MIALPGIDIKHNRQLFQCSEVKWIFSHAATALIFSLLLSFCIKAKERRGDTGTTKHNNRQQYKGTTRKLHRPEF
jgi:hypothetical protein